jgi:hypothetical protein
MGDVAAISGAVLLFVGILLIALLGNSRFGAWAPTIGIMLAVLGLSIELVGAVALAA